MDTNRTINNRPVTYTALKLYHKSTALLYSTRLARQTFPEHVEALLSTGFNNKTQNRDYR